jgi:hypothetical protein
MSQSVQFNIFALRLTLTFILACFAPLGSASGGTGNYETAYGYRALEYNTGGENSAFGYESLYRNTTGASNTAMGTWTLTSNTTGDGNSAFGSETMYHNSSGVQNSAFGVRGLSNNSTGSSNTAVGYFTLWHNTIGDFNTAVGQNALGENIDGTRNTALGSSVLSSNTSGSYNTATGRGALAANTTGSYNHAYGAQALSSNTEGIYNAAYADHALTLNSTGSYNTAAGSYALGSNTTGSNNIALGAQAGSGLTTGNNNIDIGATGTAAEANTIRIGKAGTQTKTFIQGISGVTVANGVHVVVAPSGKLGVATSSREYKEKIKPMENASEALLALKPVTFKYKQDLDPDGIPQFGLVAEEVETVDPDLVARDADGKAFTVRYEAVNAMLLNEFLKEHRKVEQLEAAQARSERTAAQQQKQIEALTSGLQKVSAEVHLGKANLQTAANQ